MTEYTEIPVEFTGENYDKWFDIDRINQKYDGNILKACEEHPSYFAYFKLGFKLRDYQLFQIDTMVKERYVFSLWGRRMGKSTVFKVFDAWAIWYNKYPQGRDKTTKILVLAHTQDSADGYIEEIRDMFESGDKRVSQVFKGKLGEHYFTDSFPKRTDNAKMNTSEISVYRNGGWNKVTAFPPTSRARGRPASVVQMDEVASWYEYTPDEYTIYADVIRPIPTDSPDTKIFGATTPKGPNGLAYDLLPIDNHKTIYKLLWFPYFYRNEPTYIEELGKIKTEYEEAGWYDKFRQEYLAELVSYGSSYFDKEKEIDKVFADTTMSMYPSSPMECHAGIDFGGSVKSRTVLTVSRYDKQSKQCIRMYHKRYPVGQDATLQDDIIDVARRFPNIKVWHVDSQGGGSSFYAWFHNKFSGWIIDEVIFKGQKADLYRLFKIACFKNKIKSYYDPELRQEFLDFTPDLKPAKHSTDDMLDSFMMSIKDWLEEKQETNWKVINY